MDWSTQGMQKPARIGPAPAKSQDLLNAVKKQVGGAPGIFTAITQSFAAPDGLSNVEHEQRVMADAGANIGDDGASVHIALPDTGFDNEAVAQIGLNIFMDYLNHIADRDIDFPSADSKVALTTWPGRLPQLRERLRSGVHGAHAEFDPKQRIS